MTKLKCKCRFNLSRAVVDHASEELSSCRGLNVTQLLDIIVIQGFRFSWPSCRDLASGDLFSCLDSAWRLSLGDLASL